MSLIDAEVGIAGGLVVNGQVLPRSSATMRAMQPAGFLTYSWGAPFPHGNVVNGAAHVFSPRTGEVWFLTSARAAALTALGAVLVLIP